MIGEPGGVGDGGEDVLTLEGGVILQDFFRARTVAQQVEDVCHANALAPDAGFPPALARLHRDAIQQVHGQRMRCPT